MKNKLVFRILGALASALIIASVFIPFVSVASYSQSLWETNRAIGTIYLPIMIIVFGVVGVLVFSTGFKTELAYASAGGLLFFLITQTIPIINQGTFNTLGVGYYCLTIGTLLIIIMAFICGIRVKQKEVKKSVVEDTKPISMIEQIDKLYNDQPVNQQMETNNGFDNVIQPLPIDMVSPMGQTQNENIIESSNTQVENNVQPIVETHNNENNGLISSQNLNKIENGFTSIPNQQTPLNFSQVDDSTNINNSIQQSNVIDSQVIVPTENNVVEQSNTSISEFNSLSQGIAEQVNPVISEFSEPVMQNLENTNIINPVMAEFNVSMPTESSFISNNNFSEQYVNENTNNTLTNGVNQNEELKTLDNINKVDVMAEPTNTNSNLDIFG